MGLDSYAYTVARDEANGDFGVKVKLEEKNELHYWRKHYDMHDTMQEIWTDKGGQENANDEFNCQLVRITLDDLDKIEDNVIFRRTDHFFLEDLKFLKKAREEIRKGNSVYYWSWY